MPGFMINGSGGSDRDPPNTIELLFSHRWYIETLGPINAKELISCKDLSLPDMKLDRQEVLGGLIWYKFAKSVRYEDAQVTFYDNNQITEKLEDWRKKIFTLKGGIQPHKDYKKDVIFVLTDGTGGTMQRYKLKYAWPSVISPGKLTYASSDIKLVTVSITFDYMELEVQNSDSSSGSSGGSDGGGGAGGGSTGSGQTPTGASNDSELMQALGVQSRDVAAIDKAVGFNQNFLDQEVE